MASDEIAAPAAFDLERHFHLVFLALALPIGLCYVFLSAPFNVPDEHTHFFRVYHLSEGKLIAEKRGDATGAPLPASLGESTFIYTQPIWQKHDGKIPPGLINATLSIPLSPRDTVFTAFSNTALYPIVPYIPHTLGVGIGRVLNVSPLHLLYIGRLFSFLTALVLLTFAFRLLPVLKPFFMLVVLTPTSMYQLASLSADSTTIAASILFIAMALRFAYGKDGELGWKSFGILLVLSIVISLSKSAYFLLPLLIFIVPRAKFSRENLHLPLRLAVVLSGWFALMIWASMVGDIYSPAYSLEQIDPEGAKNFILESPFRFLWILIAVTARDFWYWIELFIGIQEWDIIVLPLWNIILYAGLLLASLVVIKRDAAAIEAKTKWIGALVGWATLGVVMTAVYISWMPVGSLDLNAMQGRYLVPFLPLMLIPFAGLVRISREMHSYVSYAAFTLAAGSLLHALILNYLRYYTM